MFVVVWHFYLMTSHSPPKRPPLRLTSPLLRRFRIAFSTPPDLQVRYFITDHLGSVRLVADAAGNVLERNDSLPFGEKCQNNGLVSAENPYLYGGKELQTFFGIDWYDSGARFQKTDGLFSGNDPSEAIHGVPGRILTHNQLIKIVPLSGYGTLFSNPLNISLLCAT